MCVALVAISLAGCTRFEEDDLFDESASLRVTHFNEQLQSRLVVQSQGEKNGWVIQYFVSGTDELDFEGFKVNSVSEYHEYLTELYNDYMELPPLEKRKTHRMTAFRI